MEEIALNLGVASALWVTLVLYSRRGSKKARLTGQDDPANGDYNS